MTARRPASAPAPVHSDKAHAAITAVLMACTLGARRQPELRTDPAGKFGHAISQGMVHLQAGVRGLQAELAAYRFPGAR